MSGTTGDELDLQSRVVKGLLGAILEVLETMAWSEAAYTGVEEASEFMLTDEAGGCTRLIGDPAGLVGISGERALIAALVSRIVGLAPEELTDADLLDGIGELVNMVCGSMKSKVGMAETVLSPPMALLGQSCSAQWKTNHPVQVLSFQVEEHTLRVHVSF